jgi:acyl CoA:acetate/3-ketoacid CoA transferase alpha subunit
LKDFTVVSNNAGMPGVGLGEFAKNTRRWGLGLMR